MTEAFVGPWGDAMQDSCISHERGLFDIFSGSSERDAIWIEVVAGLTNAKRRMDEIAAKQPGDYFIFQTDRNSVMARTRTSAKRGEADSSSGETNR